jgi:acetyltransferase-like isoleucine patch superfamily enzyme
MFKFIKLTYYALKDEIGRFNFFFYFIRNFPTEGGFYLRERYVSRRLRVAGENIRIHEGVRFRGVHKIEAGNDVEIGVDNFLQASAGLTLEDNVMLGPGVKIWTVNHRVEDPYVPIAKQGYDHDPVSLGRGVWLGANVFIMPGVHLPEGCVVSAGSVVGKKKYPPFSIIAGNPARVIGNRKKANS